ncbi:MAG: hypothetical protein JW973_10415 [Bacteroidales bacterium]|nr:hypothetical protein [Bacteroidales bacterium]
MKSNKKADTSLPEKFRRYFWDVSFDELIFEKHSRFIAERLLNYGDLNEVRWLLSHTNRQFIKSLLKKSRNLNTKTVNFWQMMLA